MRGIFGPVAANDPQMGRALAVLSAFDALVAAAADPEQIAREAATLSGRDVVIVDIWNGYSVRSRPLDPPGSAILDDEVLMVSRAPSGAPGVVEGRCALAVEIASGRIGAVWLEGRAEATGTADPGGVPGASSDEPFDELAHLIVERLAATVAITALRTGHRSARDEQPEFHPLERLLLDDATDDTATLARRCGLTATGSYVAIAVSSDGPSRSSPEALGRTVADHLGDHGLTCRPGTIADIGLVVTPEQSRLREVLTQLTEEPRARALRLVAGVGSPQAPIALHRSWLHARWSLGLALVEPSDGPRVAHAADLGAVGVLADLPPGTIDADPDIAALLRLGATPGGSTDLDVLRTYCATESLRATARHVHLHHSSVADRLGRIERTLGVSLDDPLTRLRYLLASQLLILRETAR